MTDAERSIQERLFQMQDLKYKEFQCKLIPTISPEKVIGVRTPELRRLSKELVRQPQTAEFLAALPHSYYDENNLHGFLIEAIKDYDACVAAMEEFLPYIDNWATCDLITPKVFQKHLPELYERIKVWIASKKTYTVRFGVKMLMNFYLGEAFDTAQADMVAAIVSEEYYVNMVIAWYFATALAKQPEAILPYFTEKRMPDWTHNRAIQKSIESFRIPDETKTYLRSLKALAAK